MFIAELLSVWSPVTCTLTNKIQTKLLTSLLVPTRSVYDLGFQQYLLSHKAYLCPFDPSLHSFIYHLEPSFHPSDSI